MYETREQQRNGSGRQMRESIERERQQAEGLAQELSRQSIHQWQKTIEGAFALPTAIATTFAASTLYLVAFLARGFEVFQMQAEDARRRMDEERERVEGEPQREAARRSGGEIQSPSTPRA